MRQLSATLMILGQSLLVLAGSGEELGDWYIIPAAAHVAGVHDTFWQTDLALVNPYRWQSIRVYVKLLVSDQSNLAAVEQSFTIEAGGSLLLEDVTDTVFGHEGTGALIVRTKDGSVFSVSARTYTGENGTYGQTENGQKATNRGQETAYIAGVKSSEEYRSNYGIVNASFRPADFRVSVYDSAGQLVGRETITVERLSHVQKSIAKLATPFDDGYVKISCFESLSEDVEWVAYVSVIDNASGDAVFLEERTDRQYTDSDPGYNLTGWWSGSITDDSGRSACQARIEQEEAEVTIHFFTSDGYHRETVWGYESGGRMRITGGQLWHGRCLDEFTASGTASVSESNINVTFTPTGQCVEGTVSFSLTPAR